MNKQRSIFLFLVILLVLTPFSSAFSIFDLDGSMALITDSNGNVIEETTYKPYGEVIDDGKSRFLYTRKELDANTKMYYYGARYYDPFFRHFTQPDVNIPDVYNPQDLNRYAYVRNNPYKYVDPTGEIPVDIIVDVGFITYGAYRFAQDPSLKTFGELGADVGFAVVPFVPNVKRIKEGAQALDKGLDAVKGGEKVSDAARNIDNNKNLPDFYGTSNQQIVPSRTPAGREITPHAAERMANPPLGRDVMIPSETDRVIKQATITRVNPTRQTTTHSAPHLAGKPKVVTSNTHFGRIVTVIKNKFKNRGRR